MPLMVANQMLPEFASSAFHIYFFLNSVASYSYMNSIATVRHAKSEWIPCKVPWGRYVATIINNL